MIYNPEDLQDTISVLAHIDQLTLELGISNVEIDTSAIIRIVRGCKQDFPHSDGIEKASPFKLVANFVCHFIAERPLTKPFPPDTFPALPNITTIDNHQNAIVAFSIARTALNGALIYKQGDDTPHTISNPIHVSRHSYGDIIDALSNIVPASHFKLVTVLFEQLIYKNNSDCQYKK